MTVAEYLLAKEITAEELAALLSERLDRTISANAVITRGEKAMPKSWREALGDVETPPVVEPPPDVRGGERARRQSSQAPKPTVEFNPMLAEERVAAIYSMIGRGVATATKEPRYRTAFDEHADKCGKAWSELAKHDKHVATVLTMLTTGGPWGEVIWLHVSLGFSLLVISGKVDIGFASGIPAPTAPAPEPDAAPDGADTSPAGA